MSDWRHILVWEVSTIVIPGQRLLERCEWSFGDVQDYVAWRGGDDFVFVLPGLPLEAADLRIDTLADLVGQVSRQLWGANLLSLSAGAVTFPWHGDTPETLVTEAEKRMLGARQFKRSTKERVESGELVRMTDA